MDDIILSRHKLKSFIEVDIKKLIVLAQKLKVEYQLQRIGFILENIETMDETLTENFIDELAQYIKKRKTSYIPLASEIPISSYPRSKKWKIVINTTIESDL